jgi:hypothetical protein
MVLNRVRLFLIGVGLSAALPVLPPAAGKLIAIASTSVATVTTFAILDAPFRSYGCGEGAIAVTRRGGARLFACMHVMWRAISTRVNGLHAPVSPVSAMRCPWMAPLRGGAAACVRACQERQGMVFSPGQSDRQPAWWGTVVGAWWVDARRMDKQTTVADAFRRPRKFSTTRASSPVSSRPQSRLYLRSPSRSCRCCLSACWPLFRLWHT